MEMRPVESLDREYRSIHRAVLAASNDPKKLARLQDLENRLVRNEKVPHSEILEVLLSVCGCGNGRFCNICGKYRQLVGYR